MPDGTRVQGPVVFGNSWEIKKRHKGQLRFSRYWGLCYLHPQPFRELSLLSLPTPVPVPVLSVCSPVFSPSRPLGLSLPRALKEEEEVGLSQCSGEQQALINRTSACTVLVDPQGPFAACHHLVAPEPFQK